jgi:hypothetical protein
VLQCIAICQEFGRPDLIPHAVTMTPAAVRQYVLDQMWAAAIDKARAAKAWMPRE